MIHIRIKWRKSEFYWDNFICTARVAWNLWFNLKDNPLIGEIRLISMDGAILEPQKGINAMYQSCPEFSSLINSP